MYVGDISFIHDVVTFFTIYDCDTYIQFTYTVPGSHSLALTRSLSYLRNIHRRRRSGRVCRYRSIRLDVRAVAPQGPWQIIRSYLVD